MHVDKAKGRKAWLLWTGLLLASLILTAALFGSVESSQALSPSVAGVAKTVDPSSVLPGQTPAPLYTVTFSNPATTTLILDWITDTLPADFVFVGMDPSSDWDQPPVDTTGPVIVWENGQQVMDYTDNKFPFMEGTVGFKTHESWDAIFDEITVTQLP